MMSPLWGAQWGHHSQKVEKIIFFCKLHRNLQKINYYLFEGLKSKKKSKLSQKYRKIQSRIYYYFAMSECPFVTGVRGAQ